MYIIYVHDAFTPILYTAAGLLAPGSAVYGLRFVVIVYHAAEPGIYLCRGERGNWNARQIFQRAGRIAYTVIIYIIVCMCVCTQ